MSEAQFNVIFKGVLAGFDPQQVQASFAQLFSLDADKVEKIFAAGSATLKTGVNETTANQYVSRLAAIGVEAVAEALASSTNAAAETPASLSVSPAPSSVAPGAASTGEHEYKFEFFGKGFEYFKIWIVNILLTILTLGIYSAWAKVRNHQYFYGNTRLNNASFEYTAKPLQILKGRIIAFAFLIAYSVLSQTSPMLGAIMGLILLIALPWIVVLSLRFNARYTSYRNISFRFHGSVGGALKAFVLWPILAMFTIGILLPFAWKKQAQYITNGHTYGDAQFNFDVGVGEYYKMLLILIGGSIVFIVAFSAFFGGSLATLQDNPLAMATMIVPLSIMYLGFYFVLGAYVVSTMANIQYNNSQLGEHHFAANWTTLSYMKVLIVNTFLILLTLGLYIPFAKVRTAAYKAAHTQFIATGDIDSFVAGEKEHTNSLAEGVNDLFAMDISI